MPIMEEQEAVDYSSDRLKSIDIWAVTGGGSLGQFVDIPRLGPEDQVLGTLLGSAVAPSQSFCPVSSPVAQATAVATSVQLNEGLLGSSS